MNRYFISLGLVLFLLGGLSSCSTNRYASSQKESNQFLNNVAINSESKTNINIKNRSAVYKNSSIKTEPNENIKSERTALNNDVYTSDTSLVRFIEDWLGVRYQLGGTTKSGIDCSAFTQKLYAQVYKQDLLRTAYSQFNSSVHIFNKQELKEGDLVFFKIHSKVITHVGVYLSNGYFVQASNHGVMISSLEEPYWNKYFFAGGRMVKG